MNKNKGFIGIGLIIAIVLGIVVVGGGAYYLGKSNGDNKEVKVEENQNQPVVNNKQQAKCDSNSIPSLIVLSPNGGETYTAGQKITVKWNSCNVPSSSSDIVVALHQDGAWDNVIYLSNASINDGNEIFTIPANIVLGSYKIRVGSPAARIQQDFSDNLFTINSAKIVSITSCTSDKGNSMTFQKALEIAKKSSCNNVGKFIGEYDCNKNNGGLVDVYMEPTNKPGCAFACRVSIDTGKTEEGWMCTGAL